MSIGRLSVGWLIHDGERAKVVAPHMSKETAGVPIQGNGLMTIPSKSILRLKALTLTSVSCSVPESEQTLQVS